MDRTPTRNPARRSGFSMIDVQVAFAAFGVMLAGLCPVLVAQMRHASRLESRFLASELQIRPDQQTTYYIVPRAEPWARKLAGTATINKNDTTPAGSPPTGAAPKYTLSILPGSLSVTPAGVSVVVEAAP